MRVPGAITLSERCRNCTAIVLSRCGHWVMMERVEFFNKTCIGFLQRPETFAPTFL